MQLYDYSIAPDPKNEFHIRFVRWGTTTKPAKVMTRRVLASNREQAFKILQKAFPRSDRYQVITATPLLKTAA